MPQGGNAPPAQDQTGSLDFLWGAVGFVICVLLIWFLFKDYIVMGLVTLKIGELHLASLFSSEPAQLLPVFEYYQQNPDKTTYEMMKMLLHEGGKFMTIPFASICLLLAGIVYFGNFSTQHRKFHDMATLYDSEKKIWPQILPVAKQDLLKTPINEGPWAMALNPMEFAKKHFLLREIREQGTGAKLADRGMKVRVEVLRDKAEKVFAEQLGQRWESLDACEDYVKALYAAFVSRANHDRDTSRKLLDNISASAQAGSLDFSGVDAVLKKYRHDKRANKIINQHAYVYTVLPSLLELARTDGVLASADFLWLKPIDRKLWYILSNVGRHTAFTEVAGIFAHWLVEKELKRRFSIPMVQEAVKGLEQAISIVIYQPEEEN